MGIVRNRSTGRPDANQPADMKVVRVPVFVDNCVIMGKYTSQSGIKKSKVSPPTANHFQVATDRTYLVMEEESAIRLAHRQTPGHRYTNAIFYGSNRLDTTTDLPPSLCYAAEENHLRLTPQAVESATMGTRLTLGNMKGRSLTDIGFDESLVHLGQSVDVGLRTSDLALRIGAPMVGVFNSVTLASPRTTAKTTTDRTYHTTRFLSQDFHSVNLLTALRFLGRHDNRTLLYDRWGNLQYIPFNHGIKQRKLQSWMALGMKSRDTVDDGVNRVTVVGQRRALNDYISATVDDRSSQIAHDGSDTVRDAGVISDATVKNQSTARAVARRILRANALASGSKKSEGHIDAWDLQPGDSVLYQDRDDTSPHFITSTAHSLRGSGFHFLALEQGIEGVLQGIAESTVSMVNEIERTNEETIQKSKEDISLFLPFKLRSSLLVQSREVHKVGFRLGGHRNSTIGRKKGVTNYAAVTSSAIPLINNGGGHAAGVTALTVDTVDATTVFTAPQDIYSDGGVFLGTVTTINSSTSLTVAAGLRVAVADNAKLCLVAADDIGNSKGNDIYDTGEY